jgi:MerR family transcriptional regulator/heat shock protein HspR
MAREPGAQPGGRRRTAGRPSAGPSAHGASSSSAALGAAARAAAAAGQAGRVSSARRVRRTSSIEVASDRGVFMISVAAELAEMHPQTLRMYEARGLIEPKRSPKGTRLYSRKDVERLRRIQEMTAELGMSLAGVERVFELEEKLEAASRRVAALERRAAELKAEVERLEALRRELRAEIVPYARAGALVRRADLERLRIQLARARD